MARITILDDNKASSALMKMILTRHQHKVSQTAVVQHAINHPSGCAPDLIFINHAYNKHSGWEVFNHLKQTASNIPAMVYVLNQLNPTDTGRIIQAVDAVLAETKACCAKYPDAPVYDQLHSVG